MSWSYGEEVAVLTLKAMNVCFIDVNTLKGLKINSLPIDHGILELPRTFKNVSYKCCVSPYSELPEREEGEGEETPNFSHWGPPRM